MHETVNHPIIEISNLTVSYSKNPALKQISLILPFNKIIGIIGPNGAGKSTLLKAIMDLISIDQGSILLFGKPLNKVRKKVSYIPQKGSVDWDFPASVLDIVLLGRYAHLRICQRPRQEDKKIAMQCLEQVDMAHLANKHIGQLSGGQQQRIFLARALAQEAQLYLMDEPFAAVDIPTENKIIEILKKMVQEEKTVIIVHHDLHTVMNYFDWLVLLNKSIIASGSTKSVFNPTLLQSTYSNNLPFLY